MEIATTLIHQTFLLAGIFYFFALCFSAAKHYHFTKILFICGLVANLFSAIIRYWLALPMLPLYQGPFFLPFVIGLISLKKVFNDHNKSTFLMILITLMAWAALFFPNDYYLPFIQSKTLFSHLFFLFSIIGKSLFLMAGIQAIHYLLINIKSSLPSNKLKEITNTIIFGFAFWTLSIFSGAIWSYLGWGSPVVWDDPIITTTMATWLFYGLFLHLHLMSFGTKQNRLFFAIIGAIWVFLFNCLPDMGRFALPRL